MHFLKIIDNVGKIKEDKKNIEPDHFGRRLYSQETRTQRGNRPKAGKAAAPPQDHRRPRKQVFKPLIYK